MRYGDEILCVLIGVLCLQVIFLQFAVSSLRSRIATQDKAIASLIKASIDASDSITKIAEASISNSQSITTIATALTK